MDIQGAKEELSAHLDGMMAAGSHAGKEEHRSRITDFFNRVCDYIPGSTTAPITADPNEIHEDDVKLQRAVARIEELQDLLDNEREQKIGFQKEAQLLREENEALKKPAVPPSDGKPVVSSSDQMTAGQVTTTGVAKDSKTAKP